MAYKPAYQRRYGKCKICHQGIEAGEQIMIGTGFFKGHIRQTHNHYGCWIEEVPIRAKNWFFANGYVPKRMSPEVKAELNRLRAKRYYIQQNGGEPNEIATKVAKVEKQIALAKVG